MEEWEGGVDGGTLFLPLLPSRLLPEQIRRNPPQLLNPIWRPNMKMSKIGPKYAGTAGYNLQYYSRSVIKYSHAMSPLISW